MARDKFKGDLQTEYAYVESRILGRDYWRVLKPFSFALGNPESNSYVHVPAGYLTDGASVPRVFWNIIPPWGEYGAATTVHDVLCEYLSITVNGEPMDITRADCDNILREAMQDIGVKAAMSWMIYTAVCTYRKVFRVSRPQNDPKKRELEAAWANSRLAGDAHEFCT